MSDQPDIIIPSAESQKYEQDHAQHHQSRANVLLIFLPIWFVLLGISAYFFMNGKKNNTQNVSTGSVQVVPTTIPNLLFLSLSSLTGDVTAVNGELLVSGRTLPHTPVIIYSEIDEFSVDSDGQGQFEGSVHVGDDGGLVRVTAYGENGDEKSETIAIVSTNTGANVLGKTDMSGPKPTRTRNEANDFLQNRPFEPTERKIGALKLKELLSREGSGSAKNNVKGLMKMNAHEATPGAKLSRHAVMGTVTNISSGVITLSHQVQRDRVTTVLYNVNTVFFIKNISNATAANITIGMRIIAVGHSSDEGLLAKHIHVIPGNATGVFKKFPVASASATIVPSASATLTPTETPTPTL